MRPVVLLLILCTLAGCETAASDLTAAQKLELASRHTETEALVNAHKIGYAEASRRSNADLERLAADKLTDDDRLLMTYRVALSTEVDAGRLTPEMALFQYRAKMSELAHVQQQELLQGLAVAALGG